MSVPRGVVDTAPTPQDERGGCGPSASTVCAGRSADELNRAVRLDDEGTSLMAGFTIGNAGPGVDRLKNSEHVQHEVVFVSPELTERRGNQGPYEVALCSYVLCFTCRKAWSDADVSGVAMVPRLTSASEEVVAGRLVEGTARAGKNAPILLEDLTEEELAKISTELERYASKLPSGAHRRRRQGVQRVGGRGAVLVGLVEESVRLERALSRPPLLRCNGKRALDAEWPTGPFDDPDGWRQKLAAPRRQRRPGHGPGDVGDRRRLLQAR